MSGQTGRKTFADGHFTTGSCLMFPFGKTWDIIWKTVINENKISSPSRFPSGLTNGKTRRRMARERRGAESSVVSMETLY